MAAFLVVFFVTMVKFSGLTCVEEDDDGGRCDHLIRDRLPHLNILYIIQSFRHYHHHLCIFHISASPTSLYISSTSHSEKKSSVVRQLSARFTVTINVTLREHFCTNLHALGLKLIFQNHLILYIFFSCLPKWLF